MKHNNWNFYDNSKGALAAILSEYGADVLLGKLNSYFPDFAPSVSTDDKWLVYAVYELGAAQILKSNLQSSQADKEHAVKMAIQRLTKAHLAPDSVERIIYEFIAALGWQVGKPDKSAIQSDPNVQSQSMPANITGQSIVNTIVTTLTKGEATKSYRDHGVDNRDHFFNDLENHFSANNISFIKKRYYFKDGSSRHYAIYIKSRVKLGVDMLSRDGKIRVNIFMQNARPLFDKLRLQEAQIGSLLTFPLKWKRERGNTASRIETYISNFEINATADCLLDFVRVFEPIFEKLDVTHKDY